MRAARRRMTARPVEVVEAAAVTVTHSVAWIQQLQFTKGQVGKKSVKFCRFYFYLKKNVKKAYKFSKFRLKNTKLKKKN